MWRMPLPAPTPRDGTTDVLRTLRLLHGVWIHPKIMPLRRAKRGRRPGKKAMIWLSKDRIVC